MCLDAVVALDSLEPCPFDQNQSEDAITGQRLSDPVESLAVMTHLTGEIRRFFRFFGAHAIRIGAPNVSFEENPLLEGILEKASGQ
jgi:hypothetical protein